ncbi:MAG: MFS transporter, partial [Chloroflexota bacterium]|nr:MFS transporter [Chloroflexota bacterium]
MSGQGEKSRAGGAPSAARPSIVPGVERKVFILSIVSFFTDISSEMVYPLVPIFLTSVLGAPLAVVGAIEGVAESTASVLRVASGWLSDRVGKRKPFVVAGYILAAAGKLLLAVAFHWPTVLFARFVDRFGKGLRSAPRDALIAQWTEPGVRGRAFGFHRAADTAGAVLGPLAALALLALLGQNFRLIFALAVIPGVAGIVLLRSVGESATRPGDAEPRQGMKLA